ncbi:OsmC family protein [Leuconostoc citreum]|uniref:OsmC family protein n=1 Tax=Leuconostoc citreum TaxID=33964 RepID=UPI00338D5422
MSGKRPGFDNIGVDIHFRTPKEKTEITKFVKFMEDTCPVRDNLVNTVPIVTKEVKSEK